MLPGDEAAAAETALAAAPIDIQITLHQTTAQYGGSVSAAFSITGGTAPYSVAAEWCVIDGQGKLEYFTYREFMTYGQETLSFTIPGGVSAYLGVQAADSAGGFSDYVKSDSISITGSPLPLNIQHSLSAAHANPGDLMTGYWSITGGTAPYEVELTWEVLDVDGYQVLYENYYYTGAEGQDSIYVPNGATGKLTYLVVDANGMTETAHSTVFGIGSQPAGLSASVSLSGSAVAPGNTITAAWQVDGGQPDYILYADWYVTDAAGQMTTYPVGADELASGSATLLVPEGAYGHFKLSVYDQVGAFSIIDTPSFTIASKILPLEALVTLDKTQVNYREDISATWAITGGTQPYIVSAYWEITDAHGVRHQFSTSYDGAWSSGTDTALFNVPGGVSGYLSLFVTDALGNETGEVMSVPFTITGAPAPVAVNLSVSQTAADPGDVIRGSWSVSGGTAPYTVSYTWRVFDLHGTEVLYQNDISSLAEGYADLTVPEGARAQFVVFVSDTDSMTASADSGDILINTPGSLFASVSLDSYTVAYNTPVTATISVTGGQPPYTVNAFWRVTDFYGVQSEYNVSQDEFDTGVVTFQAPAGVEGRFIAYIWDQSTGNFLLESSPFTITGAPVPLAAAITMDKTEVNYKDSITFSWTITGGTPPYSTSTHIQYEVEAGNYHNYDHQDGTGAQGSFTGQVRAGLRGELYLWVTDSTGMMSGFPSETFTILNSPEPLRATLSNDQDSVAYQQAITSSWDITGGTPPYTVNYWWNIQKASGNNFQVGTDTSASAQGSVSLIVPAGVQGAFTVSVEDADGNRLWTTSDPFTITGSPEGPQVSVNTDLAAYTYQDLMTATWNITGGTPPYRANYQWTILDAEGMQYTYGYTETDQPQGSASLAAPIGVSGFFEFSLYDAEDESAYASSAPFSITGAPEPMRITLTNDNTSYEYQTDLINSTWSITGGTAPYTVDYYWLYTHDGSSWRSTGDGESGQANGGASLSAPNGIKGRFHVSVTDLEGNTLSAESEDFLITGAPGRIQITASNDHSAYNYQDLITSTWDIVGGVAPYRVSYDWKVSDSQGGWSYYGSVVQAESPSHHSDSLKAPGGVSGQFMINVWDSLGEYDYFTTPVFTINGAPEPIAITLSLDKAAVNYGEDITAAWEIAGGVGGFKVSYTWWIAQPGSEYFSHFFSSESSQVPGSVGLKAPSGGRGYLSVDVVDADGNTAYAQSEYFTILGSPPPLTADITLSTAQAQYGENITANWQVTGGAAPYQVQAVLFISQDDGVNYDWIDSLDVNQAVGSARFRVSMGTLGYIRLYINDVDGNFFSTASDTFTISGSPEPITVQISVSNNTLNYRDPFTVNWQVSGGVPEYEVSLYYILLDENDDSNWQYLGSVQQASGSEQLLAGLGVRAYIQLSVTDADGNRFWQNSEDITILGAPDPIQAEITLSAMEVAYQQEITAGWSITGGTAPYSIKYRWIVWPEESYGVTFASGVTTLAQGTNSQLVPAGATGSFMLVVTDAHGMVSDFSSDDFTITGSPLPYSPSVTLSATSVAYQDTITATWDISGGEDFIKGHAFWEVTNSDGVVDTVGWFDVRERQGSDSIKAPIGTSGMFTLVLYDRFDNYYQASGEFTITGSPESMNAVVTLDKTAVAFGGSVAAAWSLTGGVQPYQEVYTYWSINYDGLYNNEFNSKSTTLASGNDSLVIPGGTSGIFVIIVEDKDGNRANFVSEEFTISGSPAPIAVDFWLDKYSINTGDTLTANWEITGGTPPYTMYIDWNILEIDAYGDVLKSASYWDESTQAKGSASHRIDYGTMVELQGTVVDARGESRWVWGGQVDISGEYQHDFITAAITADQEREYYLGDTVSAGYQFSGGLTPYREMTYEWYRWESGKRTILSSGALTSPSGTLSYKPTVPGAVLLAVEVLDANGVGSSSSYYTYVLEVPRPKATALDGAVKLDWAAVTGASRYKVSILENGAYRVLDDSLTALTYTAAGLTNGVAYSFLVQAWIDASEDWTLAADDLLVTATPKPAIPSPWRASVKVTKIEALNGSSLKLTWNRIAGATGYQIERATNRNGPWTHVTYTTGLTFTNSRLKAGTMYFYRMRTYDIIDGQRVISGKNSAVYAGIPVATTRITATQSISTSRLKLTWAKSAGATSYQIFLALKPGGPFNAIRTTPNTFITLTGLRSGTYYFIIKPYKRVYTTTYYAPQSPMRQASTLLK